MPSNAPSFPSGTLGKLAQPVKDAITANVVAMFNDQSRGEKPVKRRTDGLFGPNAVAWRVHGDVTSMIVGGVAGLLLQMLHPAVLAGVWDHSNFRADMHGRLRRTARFIALTTYGGQDDATAMIARIRGIHGQVTGTLPDGTAYRANDPSLLAWVHVTEATSFLKAWIRYAEPRMSGPDQDRYFAEMAQVASRLGADPIPRSRAEARRLIEAMRPQLHCDARTREGGTTGSRAAGFDENGRTAPGAHAAGRDRPAAGLGTAYARVAEPGHGSSVGPGRHVGHRPHGAVGFRALNAKHLQSNGCRPGAARACAGRCRLALVPSSKPKVPPHAASGADINPFAPIIMAG